MDWFNTSCVMSSKWLQEGVSGQPYKVRRRWYDLQINDAALKVITQIIILLVIIVQNDCDGSMKVKWTE